MNATMNNTSRIDSAVLDNKGDMHLAMEYVTEMGRTAFNDPQTGLLNAYLAIAELIGTVRRMERTMETMQAIVTVRRDREALQSRYPSEADRAAWAQMTSEHVGYTVTRSLGNGTAAQRPGVQRVA